MTDLQKLWRLIDGKDDIIAKWTRELAKEGPLAGLSLTAHQRRVISTLRWEREVSKFSDDPMAGVNRELQPSPVAGQDANRRIVVQRLERGVLKMWALTRDGGPTDIKEPVHSLKDGRRINIPSHIHTIEEQ